MRNSRLIAAGLISLALLGTGTAPAAAQTVAGAVSGQALFTFHERPGVDGRESGVGGLLIGDITYPIGVFRIGGALGLGANGAEVDDASRVFMPVTVSLGLVFRPSKLWIDVRGRAGIWAGATNQGLAAGPLFSIGAFIGYSFGPQVAVGPVLDAFFAFGSGDTIAVAPGLSLIWVPASDED